MALSIVSLSDRPAPKAKRLARVTRKRRLMRLSALSLGIVALALTALSLAHLAHGVSIVTGAEAWEGWAMAGGIDLGFIALELSSLAIVHEYTRRKVRRFTAPAIVGTLVGSAVMNAFAFASQATSPALVCAAIVMGVAIPALIYCLTRIGATLYLDATKV